MIKSQEIDKSVIFALIFKISKITTVGNFYNQKIENNPLKSYSILNKSLKITNYNHIIKLYFL